MNDHLHTHVEPFPVTERATAAELLKRMAGTSFQARNLAQAGRIWARMLQDEVTIFLGLAGAMVPAGMRRVLVYLIENRMVDCLVSTGANLFHDVYETAQRYSIHSRMAAYLIAVARVAEVCRLRGWV